MKNVPIDQSQGKSGIQNERSRCGQVVVVVVGKGTCGVTWMRRRLFYISTTGCTASTCTSTCTASTCANTQFELHRRLDAPSPLKHFYIWMRRFTTVHMYLMMHYERTFYISTPKCTYEHTHGTQLHVQIHDLNCMYIRMYL